MSRIFFCGDTHGRFDHIVEAVDTHRPAAVVIVGDLQAQQPLEIELADILTRTEVWFIHGNHDTDSDADHDHLFGSALADRNLDGRVVEIAGVRIAGLGGVFRARIWRPPEAAQFESKADYLKRVPVRDRWRESLPLRDRSTIFPEDFKRLAKQRADVLVTHEAPSCHPFGSAALEELARSLRVRAAFHGHHHERIDYSAVHPQLGFAAHSIGLRGITDLDGNVIREGERESPRPGAPGWESTRSSEC